VKKLVKKHFKNWKKSTNPEIPVKASKSNVTATQIDFIDMPNAVQSNVSLTSNVDLKMNDADYHSVLIANKILGGGFNSYLNMNLREEHGYTYGARSSVGSNKYAARFTAGASVRNAVTDSTVVQALKEINRIKTEDVADDALANAKAKYVGDFVLALESPQTIARYALNIKINDLPADFYTTYLEKINAPAECSLCHLDPATVWPDDHNYDYINAHAEDAYADQAGCSSKCHQQLSFCTDCHFKRTISGTYSGINAHKPAYKTLHGLDARISPLECGSCHQAGYCADCHRRSR